MSQINFEDETLDASDGVTRLLLAAEYWKEKATTLRAELEKAKSVPMKYRRMEFNAQLQNENTRLRAKIEAMERQEPAMWANYSNIISAKINKERRGAGDQHTCSETKTAYHDAPLYALPGAQAQPAPSVPEGWKLVPIEPTTGKATPLWSVGITAYMRSGFSI